MTSYQLLSAIKRASVDCRTLRDVKTGNIAMFTETPIADTAAIIRAGDTPREVEELANLFEEAAPQGTHLIYLLFPLPWVDEGAITHEWMEFLSHRPTDAAVKDMGIRLGILDPQAR